MSLQKIMVSLVILTSLFTSATLSTDLIRYGSERGQDYFTNNATSSDFCPNNFQNYMASIQYSKKQKELFDGIQVFKPFILILKYISIGLSCVCIGWCQELTTYSQFQKEYNKMEDECMPREEFAWKRDLLIETLRRSRSQDNHYFVKSGQRQPIHVLSIKKIKQKKPLLTEIELEGKDLNAKWKARGYILSKKNEIFMWLLKEYKESQKILGASITRQLIYKSTEFGTRSLMEGQWFYKARFWSQNGGTWTLEESNLGNEAANELMLPNAPAE